MTMRAATLGDICEFNYGKSLPASQRQVGSAKVYGSNGPVGTHIDALLKGPAIIVGRKGSYGEVHYSEGPLWPIDTTYYVDKNSTECDLRWLHYLLKSLPLTTLNKSAAVPGLNREDAYRLPVLVPALGEQRRIAAILDEAGDLRRKIDQSLETLDELEQSIFNDVVGKHHNRKNDWKSIGLLELFNVVTGKLDSNAARADGPFPFFTCAKETSAIDVFAFDCEALLLAGNNANGDYSVKYYSGKFNAYQRTYVLTLKNAAISYQYLKVALGNKLGDLKRRSKGTNTKYLTLKILAELTVVLPDLESQQRFEEAVKQIESIRSRVAAQQHKANSLFYSLQSRAFANNL